MAGGWRGGKVEDECGWRFRGLSEERCRGNFLVLKMWSKWKCKITGSQPPRAGQVLIGARNIARFNYVSKYIE